MLALKKQPNYVEKIMQLPNGLWAVVVFELVQVNGKVIAKAVSGKVIPQNTQEEVLALPTLSVKEIIAINESPYFVDVASILKDLSFITSQPTRGPAFQ